MNGLEGEFTLMLQKKLILFAAVALTAVTLLTGCRNDGPETREAMKSALSKHTEMTSYRFAGSADITMTLSGSAQEKPLTAALTALLKESRIEWSGIASTQPIRLESEMKLTPKGSSSTIQLPMMIKDSKLYAHIPLLNKEEEYTVWDSPTQVENLKNAQAAGQEILSIMISDVDPKAFHKDDSGALTLTITEKNAQSIAESWSKRWSEMAGLFTKYGLSTEQQFGAAPNTNGSVAPELVIHAPGEIKITTDAEGFVKDLSVQVSLTIGINPAQSSLQLALSNSYSDVNQSPSFSKDIPSNLKPFEEFSRFFPKP
jgi:hypothetical protein